MTDAARNPDNYCYRHPDRQSFVLCQRCGRTICPECQTQAAVGVHCPECVREARQSAPRGASVGKRASRLLSSSGGRPIVTYALMAVCVVIYAIQFFGKDQLTAAWVYVPFLTSTEPWRMITSVFIHASIIHLAVNMYSLFVLGRQLESVLGRARYLALFLIAGFGGSVGVLLIAPAGTGALGASGAIFGMLGAFFVIQRRLGGSSVQLISVIVLNLAIGFLLPGIAWQAHVGGLITGGVVAFVYLETRRRDQRWLQVTLTGAVVVALIAITVVKANYFL